MKSLYERQLLPMTIRPMEPLPSMLDIQARNSMFPVIIPTPFPLIKLVYDEFPAGHFRRVYYEVFLKRAYGKHKVRGKKRRLRRFDWNVKHLGITEAELLSLLLEKNERI